MMPWSSTITWVVGVLSAFWCIDTKGGESVGFASLVSSLVSLCFRFVEPSFALACLFVVVFM